MSLLQINDYKLNKLAQVIFDRQMEKDPKLETQFDERRKRSMYNDILYNLSYLNVAMEFNDEKLFTNYAVWLYNLLCPLMKDLGDERVKKFMISHYMVLKEVLSETMDHFDARKAGHHLDNAIKVTENEYLYKTVSDRFQKGKHLELRKKYLKHLLDNETKEAVELLGHAYKSGLPLEEIYQDIVQETMYEVGNLWHKNLITIGREHYCTSTSQMALSQFYPMIFGKERKNRSVLVCAVGSELHEMGARMVSDLFEYHGWDSIYLGAAVPEDAVLKAVGESKPSLVALSVTMPQHLTLCYEIVQGIKKEFPRIKIAVGGRAFQTTDNLWQKWGVDIYADTAHEFVKLAEKFTVVESDGV
ncbi:cobalamin B12-binding domain-containing protein [Alkalibacter mobilis]|uniref:cobalamin B12-binding domain-containing protein n=1 Tax=Alkalibacter mobilis TaxID=2787712 RepID=UPI00189E8D71|nr:cobalamin-dependent protein [Alkalibacter mobilis]MBF7097021.1 cobalamin-dependent protein [Alkalibacter mobilis]